MSEPLADCAGCRLGSYCGARCPRLAAFENGSVLAKSSRACELASISEEMEQALAAQSET